MHEQIMVLDIIKCNKFNTTWWKLRKIRPTGGSVQHMEYMVESLVSSLNNYWVNILIESSVLLIFLPLI